MAHATVAATARTTVSHLLAAQRLAHPKLYTLTVYQWDSEESKWFFWERSMPKSYAQCLSDWRWERPSRYRLHILQVEGDRRNVRPSVRPSNPKSRGRRNKRAGRAVLQRQKLAISSPDREVLV